MILSVSSAERFDHTQKRGCERAWWFERTNGLKPEETSAQKDGTAGHALLADYFEKGTKPAGRVKMGKAVTGAIVKGDLPVPGPDLLVERRFSGQPKYGPGCECGHGAHEGVVCPDKGCPCTTHEPEWLKLDESKTLWIGGVPWEGFIDLAYRRDDLPEVLDHKFVADITTSALAPGELIKTLQLPVYVRQMQRIWPDATSWRIGHHYVSKVGVSSLIRRSVVSNDEVAERIAHVESLVPRMAATLKIDHQDQVPFNKRTCEYVSPSGLVSVCPHSTICRAFKEKARVSLSSDEAALFAVGTPPVAEAPAPLPPPMEPEAVPKAPAEKCACGAEITADNGSRLQSGAWKHINCPLDAPAPEPVAEPKPKRTRKAKGGPAVVVASQEVVEFAKQVTEAFAPPDPTTPNVEPVSLQEAPAPLPPPTPTPSAGTFSISLDRPLFAPEAHQHGGTRDERIATLLDLLAAEFRKQA